MSHLRVSRIHDEPSPDDGFRVLADRLWPRGVSKEAAAIDLWAKELTPSHELRKQFHADGDFDAFRERYLSELEDSPADVRDAVLAHETVTLLTAAKDPEHGHLSVLREFLLG